MNSMVRAYALLMPLATLSVLVQGIVFGGKYSQGQAWYQTVHQHLGETSLLVVVICLLLAVLGRFPSASRIIPLTALLAALWVAQYLLGQYADPTSDVRSWFSFVHIPLAFIVFGLALLLSGRAHRHMSGGYADAQG